jgi:hypothetical protein
MTQGNNSTTRSIQSTSLAKCIFIGGGIALALITIFLLKAGSPDPGWPKFWQIRPLVIVPLAGAAGGVCYYLMNPMRNQGGWQKIVANILSLLVYIIGLWMGTVLGLDGTMWD